MNRNRVNLPKKCNPTNKINKVHVTKALYYILVSLLSLLFVYIIMFTIKYLITGCYLRQNYFSYLLSLDFNKPCISKKKSASYIVRKIEDDKEVFHIGNQNYSYKQAKCKCESYNSKLATKNQLIKAYNKGANWCTYGWTDGQHAYYPVQKCLGNGRYNTN